MFHQNNPQTVLGFVLQYNLILIMQLQTDIESFDVVLLFYVGTVEVLAYPSLKLRHNLMAHTAGCYCIAMDPLGR